ncbi:MAG: hypothetical protein HN564_06075 [Flavobacteriales bacterium]|jgi:hypothetical protein|nr:hypothetical protein [Flavobacteriales bacterium]
MKRTLLIVLISLSCIDLFSEITDTINTFKKGYNDLELTSQKLDLIYNEILGKQISDFKKIESEKNKWKEKYQTLKNSSSNSKLQLLKDQNDKFLKRILILEESINKNDQNIVRLETNIKNLSKQSEIEKENLISEISYIFKNEGMISVEILEIIKMRALLYKVDSKYISNLDDYIYLNQKISQAQVVLSRKFNDLQVKSQINILKNLKNKKITWQQTKVSSLIILLDSYCDKNLDLYNLFSLIDDFHYSDGVISDQSLVDRINEERNSYTDYPFLLDEYNKKRKDTNYKSSIAECY